MISRVIYNTLKDDATFSAITTNIDPHYVKQGSSLPYCVYFQEDNEPTDTKDGVSTVDNELWTIRFYSKDYEQTVSMADAARSALDRLSGTIQGVVLNNTVFRDQFDDYNKDDDTHMVEQEYNFRIDR